MCLIYAALSLCVVSCTAEDRIDVPKVSQMGPPPAGGAVAAAKPVQAVAPIPTPMDTFRALAPAEGMKVTPLFAEPIKDEDARFKRLEDQVQSLRNDFDTTVPTLVRLVAVEKDMKNLVAQLQTLTDANAPPMPAAPPPPVTAASPVMAAPVAAKPVVPAATSAPKQQPAKKSTNAASPAKSGNANQLPAGEAKASSPASPEAAPKGNQSPEGAASLPLQPLPMKNESVSAPAAPAPPAPPASASIKSAAPAAAPPTAPASVSIVKDVRAGDHGGITHLVIEMTAKTGYTALLLEGNKQVVIQLPDASWSAKPAMSLKGSALVTGYKYEKGQVVVDLSSPAALKSKKLLKPDGNPNYRLDIELTKAGTPAPAATPAPPSAPAK